jgi:hypothetical protein
MQPKKSLKSSPADTLYLPKDQESCRDYFPNPIAKHVFLPPKLAGNSLL